MYHRKKSKSTLDRVNDRQVLMGTVHVCSLRGSLTLIPTDCLIQMLIKHVLNVAMAFQVAQQETMHLPVQETWVQPLGWEDPLEKGMATHSSILAWKIPWTEGLGRLQSMASQKSWA